MRKLRIFITGSDCVVLECTTFAEGKPGWCYARGKNDEVIAAFAIDKITGWVWIPTADSRPLRGYNDYPIALAGVVTDLSKVAEGTVNEHAEQASR